MDSEFADWYRLAGLESKDEELGVRWQGVEAVVKGLDAKRIPSLLLTLFGQPAGSTMRDELREQFKAIDATFPMFGNDLEMSILAGSVLCHALSLKRPELANAAALGLTCTDCKGLRSVEYGKRFLARAEAYLRRASFELRAPLELPKFPTGEPQYGKVIELLAQACVANDAAAANQHFTDFSTKVASAIKQASSATRTAVAKLAQHLKLVQEEANIAWWILGEYSRDLDVPIKTLRRDSACLVIGKELSDLVHVQPGPVSARAFIGRLIGILDADLSSEVQLKEAVNGLQRSWREDVVGAIGRENVGYATPALLAIAKSLETDGEDDWLPVFEKASGLAAQVTLKPVDLGQQIYQECLFSRAVVE